MVYENKDKITDTFNPMEPNEQATEANVGGENRSPAVDEQKTSRRAGNPQKAKWWELLLCFLFQISCIIGVVTIAAIGCDWIGDVYNNCFPFEYKINDDGVTIVRYRGNRARVVVPLEIKGRPVVAIDSGAFYMDFLTEVSLPDSLQSIGAEAFYCCDLTEVSLPDGVQSIGFEAFAICEFLKQVSFPDGLQSIGNGAFSDCVSLTEVSLPDGLQSIDENAFCRCASLTEVSLPDSLQSIGENAFYKCSPDLTLNVAAGSVAEKYARENNIRFEVRSESVVESVAAP